MRALESYLQPKPQLAAFFWLAPLALVGAAIATAWHAQQVAIYANAVQERSAALQGRVAARAAYKPVVVDAVEQARWAKVDAERNFRWDDVFAAVERSDRENIELLGFEPEKVSRTIVLRGEALDREALSAYLSTLAEQPMLSQVHVVHMQQITRDRLETVSFDIKAVLQRQ
jgi:hypothetical protein